MPNWLSLREAARSIESGDLTSESLVAACLQRIAERESDVGAWVSLDSDRAIRSARQIDNLPRKGAMHGIPVGVKDLIDTSDMPTTYGSTLYEGHQPAADAACVAAIRRAGALVLGKTLTTEFAFFPPGKTANPINLEYTPGGSSSGSAAAVADGMVPVAFGTQTNASVIRPAAFCGIVGYKMSFGQFGMAGIKPFAPSLDTLGMFTRSVDDLPLMRSALLGVPDTPPKDQGAPSVAVCFTPEYGEPDEYCKRRIEEVAGHFANAGAHVRELHLPAVFGRLLKEQEKIVGFEAQQSFIYERDQAIHDLHPDFRQFLDDARTITLAEYLDALDYTETCRQALASAREQFDILLTPGVFGEAPHGREWTGSPLFCRIWTQLHLPTISLPAGVGPNNMPIGVQLVGRTNQDEKLIAAASWAEATLARLDL